MDDAQRQLRALVETWRVRHDLKPSEIVDQLLEAALHFAPTAHEEPLRKLAATWRDVGKPKD